MPKNKKKNLDESEYEDLLARIKLLSGAVEQLAGVVINVNERLAKLEILYKVGD